MQKQKFMGIVERQTIAKGSKSEHEAIVLQQDGADSRPLKIRLQGGNPFYDAALESFVGKHVSFEAVAAPSGIPAVIVEKISDISVIAPLSNTHKKFIENCEDILSKQSCVSINETALEAFAKTLKKSDFVPDWKEYISPAANDAASYDFTRAFYELATITAQNGGYIYADENGTAQKWGKDGSGAKAMVEKMAEIRAAKALPFYDITPAEVDTRIASLLKGVPFAEKRLAIFKEFASAENHGKMVKLLDSAFDGTAYKFDMNFVKKLAALFPEGLGNDPFFKKATLTALMVAGNAHHHGIKVDVSDLVVAADYILPQVLNADSIGILSFSPGLQEILEKRELLPEDSDKVAALRAAAVVVCEKLSRLSGLSAQDIDSSLWLAGRKLQNARPHMMCSTTRF